MSTHTCKILSTCLIRTKTSGTLICLLHTADTESHTASAPDRSHAPPGPDLRKCAAFGERSQPVVQADYLAEESILREPQRHSDLHILGRTQAGKCALQRPSAPGLHQQHAQGAAERQRLADMCGWRQELCCGMLFFPPKQAVNGQPPA